MQAFGRIATVIVGLAGWALLAAWPVANHAQEVSQPGGASVALDLSSGRPVVPVRIGDAGDVLTATLDTGAMGITIRRSVAERLALPAVGEAWVGSPFGGEPISVQVVGLPGLTVGGAAQERQGRSLDAIVLDDARFIASTDLVIGPSQFPRRLLELSLAQRRLSILPAPAVAAPDWLPTGPGGLLKTELRIQGHSVPAHVDTGSPYALDLPDRLALQLTLKEAPRDAGEIRTVNARLPVRTAPWEGQFDLAGQSMAYAGLVRFAPIPLANVGTAALRGAVIRIDTAHARWQLSLPSP